MFGVHPHIREVTHRFGIEERAQGVLYIIAVKIRLDIEQQAGLHRHAAAVEPMLLEIIDRVTVLIREIEIIFVIFDDPIRFAGMDIERAGNQQMQRSFQRLANPPEAAATAMNVRRDLRDGGAIAQLNGGRRVEHSRSAPIDLGQPPEVVRVAAERLQQPLDEPVLVVDA